jgi:DNA-binding CsgD family transcriptional regulator
MRFLVPLDCFERLGLPVFATDPAGIIRYCNRDAARLLLPEEGDGVGRRCWRLTRLRTPERLPFCARECPLRRQARAGQLDFVCTVDLSRGQEQAALFDLMAFVVPPRPLGRFALWHVLIPVPPAQPPASHPLHPRLLEQAGRLHLLSRREQEILQALSTGLAPAAVGQQLFISEVTVHNHIQHILRKLGLHRLIDAILVAVDATVPHGRPSKDRP